MRKDQCQVARHPDPGGDGPGCVPGCRSSDPQEHSLQRCLCKRGEAALEKGDWPAAYKNLQEYLGRNPNDVEILKKYAKARLSVRPLEAAHIIGAISAYRRVLQLDPLDDVAYEQLAILYPGVGNFDDLAYIARMRLEHEPDDRKAPLWLADAL